MGNNIKEFRKGLPYVLGLKLYLDETTGGYKVGLDKLDAILDGWESDKPVLVHAEGPMMGQVIKKAENHECRIYFCHISQRSEVEQLAGAQQRHPGKFFGEVSPHHLGLNRLTSKAIMKPPLATPDDQEALWNAILSGVINTLGTDHAPHPQAAKLSANPPFGVPGLETALGVLLKYSELSPNESFRRLSLQKIIELTHDNPLRIFGLKEEPDSFIKVALVDWKVDPLKLKTKSRQSPFEDLFGQVVEVYRRGKKIYDHGEILAKPGSGRIYPF